MGFEQPSFKGTIRWRKNKPNTKMAGFLKTVSGKPIKEEYRINRRRQKENSEKHKENDKRRKD